MGIGRPPDVPRQHCGLAAYHPSVLRCRGCLARCRRGGQLHPLGSMPQPSASALSWRYTVRTAVVSPARAIALESGHPTLLKITQCPCVAQPCAGPGGVRLSRHKILMVPLPATRLPHVRPLVGQRRDRSPPRLLHVRLRRVQRPRRVSRSAGTSTRRWAGKKVCPPPSQLPAQYAARGLAEVVSCCGLGILHARLVATVGRFIRGKFF